MGVLRLPTAAMRAGLRLAKRQRTTSPGHGTHQSDQATVDADELRRRAERATFDDDAAYFEHLIVRAVSLAAPEEQATP